MQKQLADNEQRLRDLYANCSDVVFRSFRIGGTIRALAIYIDGLTNQEELERSVLSVLMQTKLPKDSPLTKLLDNLVPVTKSREMSTVEQCLEAIANGNPVLLIDQQERAIAFGLARWEKRQIEEPVAEGVVRGPREGFTESLHVNAALLRRQIKTPALKMEQMQIGGYTQTQVVLAYMEGIVDEDLVAEVRARLGRIEIDGVLESGYIEELIEDHPASPFPQILTTERPDVTCGNLLEGRIAILVDGTPFVLIAPTTLFSLLQSSEDYYQRSLASTTIRWLRYLFTAISFLLPSLYVALITFHHEMVPTSLLISMAASREAVPFPALVEALLMEITFEALREAGVRLPKQVGAAVSIVGALVIGQAAVQAGLVCHRGRHHRDCFLYDSALYRGHRHSPAALSDDVSRRIARLVGNHARHYCDRHPPEHDSLAGRAVLDTSRTDQGRGMEGHARPRAVVDDEHAPSLDGRLSKNQARSESEARAEKRGRSSLKWGLVAGMSALVCILFAIEWPRLSRLPRRDKMTFIALVFIGWVLSMFDLPNLPGPTTMINEIFEPLGHYLE